MFEAPEIALPKKKRRKEDFLGKKKEKKKKWKQAKELEQKRSEQKKGSRRYGLQRAAFPLWRISPQLELFGPSAYEFYIPRRKADTIERLFNGYANEYGKYAAPPEEKQPFLPLGPLPFVHTWDAARKRRLEKGSQ